MLKFVAVLCTVFLASWAAAYELVTVPKYLNDHDWESTVINVHTEPLRTNTRLVPTIITESELPNHEETFSELAYNRSRLAWVAATKTANKKMERCTKMANRTIDSVEKIHRIKLAAVIDYTVATVRYVNQTLAIISNFSQEYASAMQQDLVSRVYQVEEVRNLTRSHGYVDTSQCEKFANGSTVFAIMPGGNGRHMLLTAAHCNARIMQKALMLRDRIHEEILNGEVERIEKIWEYVEACGLNGRSQKFTPEAVAACHRQGQRQMARGGGVLIQLVRDKIDEMTSLLADIRKNHDKCKTDAGIPEYQKYLDDVVKNTTECIDRTMAEARRDITDTDPARNKVS